MQRDFTEFTCSRPKRHTRGLAVYRVPPKIRGAFKKGLLNLAYNSTGKRPLLFRLAQGSDGITSDIGQKLKPNQWSYAAWEGAT